MGQGSSGVQSNPLEDCLKVATSPLGSYAFHDKLLFQLTDVKPYNLDYPVNPIAVTYPGSTKEVAQIIKCATTYDKKVQARSGGHSYANFALGDGDGAIVIDMQKFKQFSMDTSTWQATIGPGTLLGDVSKRLHENGNRVIPHGTSPQIGFGGHGTIGGLGPLSRMYGLTLDSIEEVEAVLANGQIVRASKTQNEDLFFAIRGAAASVAVVTEFKVRTYPEPSSSVLYSYTLQGGSVASRANAFKQWQKLTTDPSVSRKFASTFVLSEAITVVTGTFFGTQAEFDSLDITSRLPADMISNNTEVKNWLGVVGHWGESLALRAGGGIPAHFYSKSLGFKKDEIMDDATVDKLFNYIDKADKGGAVWFVIWDLEGGAISDVPTTETSYGHRDAIFFQQSYAINLLGRVKDDTHEFLNRVNSVIMESNPGGYWGAYPGYVDTALGNSSAKAYWGINSERLQTIKSWVDAGDVFHNPQSVRPK
ncbi:GlcD FAD FMN-containing dehydrogenase [Pyrenophora tritici-repentis]|uniref:FAD-linked oxidoreductase YvdP protein n=2 Tax=Pyrenophora tritici-repentis TaxID=45151 RepID=A0A2W1EIZ4_9PLEO|nr:6-hydroxy-D-nicotine oxidase [Pyrenophora tritici-repentis Pt-1C-BFP]KAA8625438.1 FAD-linked oxidoreductase YvdP-like protein [Pyrenophora tritici-repentis]EDU40250.1 6-hydroxy-D-nicotine oxidase [Pyrenophora tritici-repentis Pt-1C-BFP]KAF7453838.1 FAD-linked oxidoreductase YvdP protein [Pyrenophora tritici-repentis]KAF7576931.1 GlcD, FAD-FMN-containing dehydrogenase [Pyrenophora tritici-repentis]KAG9387599.1 FAD-linked oxidoreductase YvdP protein [Pyrenophora tritici-repentis]